MMLANFRLIAEFGRLRELPHIHWRFMQRRLMLMQDP
jgi:hypothetical protein